METIRLHIAGREYPLKAAASEVASLQRTAEAINAQYSKFKDQFKVDDPVDLLAMTALQLASDQPQEVPKSAPEMPGETLKRMQQLSERIQQLLEV